MIAPIFRPLDVWIDRFLHIGLADGAYAPLRHLSAMPVLPAHRYWIATAPLSADICWPSESRTTRRTM